MLIHGSSYGNGGFKAVEAVGLPEAGDKPGSSCNLFLVPKV